MAQGYCILILPELKIRLPTGSRMEAIVQSPRMMVASELNAWTVEKTNGEALCGKNLRDECY